MVREDATCTAECCMRVEELRQQANMSLRASVRALVEALQRSCLAILQAEVKWADAQATPRLAWFQPWDFGR